MLDLLLLAPDLQARVVELEAIDGAEPMAERTLRAVAHAGTWGEQRVAWRRLFSTSNDYCRHQPIPLPCAPRVSSSTRWSDEHEQ
ncbi:hypothetical protein NR798_30955 [Archangium gephyra]|uniref:hypothetical protein n=1 Tax=Archangium gephyra TaxID=48 RepID=UPI0035D3DAD9